MTLRSIFHLKWVKFFDCFFVQIFQLGLMIDSDCSFALCVFMDVQVQLVQVYIIGQYIAIEKKNGFSALNLCLHNCWFN